MKLYERKDGVYRRPFGNGSRPLVIAAEQFNKSSPGKMVHMELNGFGGKFVYFVYSPNVKKQVLIEGDYIVPQLEGGYRIWDKFSFESTFRDMPEQNGESEEK